MARTRSTMAFVLRAVDYGDRDVIVTLFGRTTGRFAAIAKNARGSKRRFGGGLQPMRCLEAIYTARPNRDLARLEEIDVLEDFPGLESDYDAIAVGSYATGLVRELTVDANPQPKLFDLLGRLFRKLDEADPEPLVLEVALRHFQLALFELLGEAPSLEQCFRCGTSVDEMPKVYAARAGTGVICADCTRTGEAVGVLAPATVDVLRYLRQPEGRPPEALADNATLAQARRFVDATVRRLLDRPLDSRAMLDDALLSATGAPGVDDPSDTD